MTATAVKAPQFTKADIINRVSQTLSKHGLDSLGWKAEVGSAKKVAGSCNYAKKAIRISLHLANLLGEESLNDTILHEVAHAIAGPGTGHGPVWKKICKDIGGKPNRVAVVPSEVLEYTWEFRCPNCSFSGKRNRRVRGYCPECFPSMVRIEFRRTGTDSPWYPYF